MSRFRSEWKYLVCESDISIIYNKLKTVMKCDTHSNSFNVYEVKSLYFDDYSNSFLYDNEAGVGKRYKWRIRYYGNNNNFLKLEKKEKIYGLCRKRSCSITLKEYEDIVAMNNLHKYLYSSSQQLLKEFCIEIQTKLLKPKIIVEYERSAFFEPISNIRITFDKNICASNDINRFIYGDYIKYPILPKNQHIYEIKFDDILPSYIKHASYIDKLQQTTFSKYYISRQVLERN